jgi:hypothetical protein
MWPDVEKRGNCFGNCLSRGATASAAASQTGGYAPGHSRRVSYFRRAEAERGLVQRQREV